ncbi:CLUMA_CG002776, isoform A [Clunio marinus]|uniref:CLUMA_CG002776, isoform A n=1 Tax=Clunio marinus TaxID=568069 RepID=A0A1J1HLV2_9DIPT|nr:CLUMA_CG002776, isoform A [Clunio marinus]
MPGTFSKSFKILIADKTCSDLVHPGLTCMEAMKLNLVDGIIGGLKFYLPIFLIPLFMKIKDWKKVKTWKDFLKGYGRSCLFALCLNFCSFTGICFTYKWLPLFLTLPAGIGSLFFCFVPPKVRKAEGQGMFNMYVEFLIRRSRSKLIASIRQSKVVVTLLFSILNTCIVYGYLRKASINFWFTSFRITKQENDDKTLAKGCKLIHDEITCFDYLKQELKQTAKFAFALAAIKAIPGRISMLYKQPLEMPKRLLTKFDYEMFMFIMSLNGIFKYLFCLLNRKSRFSIETNCIVSSLISGVGFLFYPQYIVFTMAMTNAVESIYHCIEQSFKSRGKELPLVMKLINKFPLVYFMFLFTAGLDIQLRILYPSLVNKYTHKILSVLTNGKGDELAKNVIKLMIGFE